MKYKLRTLLILVLVLGLLIGCNPADSADNTVNNAGEETTGLVEDTPVAEAPPAEPQNLPEPTATQPPQPTAVEEVEPTVTPEPEVLSEEDLDMAFAAFLGQMVAYNTISLEDTNLALAEDPPPFLLDVRD
ncbi:MAG: hypothetical protein KC418_12505, partial [Anaerolineales bacterium]|nr:hypothetical protein [Anaerolineales bacterium]